jgi:hypothetical protein
MPPRNFAPCRRRNLRQPMGMAMLRFPSRVGFSSSFFVVTLEMVFHIVFSRFFCTSVADPNQFYADPHPTFHFDAVPDSDPSFQIKAPNLEKVLK